MDAPEEAKEKKTRTVTPRSATHQAALDAVHKWLKSPFADNREPMLKALLEHKRAKMGDSSITTL